MLDIAQNYLQLNVS